METKVKVGVFSKKNIEKIKQLCDRHGKKYEIKTDFEIIIIGTNLEELLTEIKTNFLGQVYN